LVIGTQAWDRLKAKEKKWLQEAADEAVAYQRKIWVIAEQEAMETLKTAGVTITRPDKTLFAAKTKALLEQYESDPEMHDLIRQILALQ